MIVLITIFRAENCSVFESHTTDNPFCFKKGLCLFMHENLVLLNKPSYLLSSDPFIYLLKTYLRFLMSGKSEISNCYLFHKILNHFRLVKFDVQTKALIPWLHAYFTDLSFPFELAANSILCVFVWIVPQRNT